MSEEEVSSEVMVICTVIFLNSLVNFMYVTFTDLYHAVTTWGTRRCGRLYLQKNQLLMH